MTTARRVARDVLIRVDADDAWIAPVLDAELGRSDLEPRDRALATDLAYGVTRRRRALDAAAAPFIRRELDPEVRVAVRIGTYQLLDQRTPPHAAVSEAVDLAPKRARGLVNAVLRRVADAGTPRWATDGERLSYPEWIVDRLAADLGEDDALAALSDMNVPVPTPARADGYRQDPASTWVVDAVEARQGDLVVDLCAAPGGKSTGLRAAGAEVVAVELHPNRARSVRAAGERTGNRVAAVTADGRRPPLRTGVADRVLVDAPCAGLGAHRRRADARWRIEADDVDRLADLQVDLVESARTLVRPGGTLLYSACTLTAAESTGVVDRVVDRTDLMVEAIDPGDRWRTHGDGVLVLPQDHRTDGMFACRFRVPS
ncbi:MAG: transcription antitermination factor NusB [Actinomycetota bacterium]